MTFEETLKEVDVPFLGASCLCGDQLVVGVVRTHHPDHYRLVNLNDGNTYRLNENGYWQSEEVD